MRAFVDFPISFIMPTPALQRANILLRLREEFRIHPHETRNEILDVLSTSPINDWYSLWTKLAVATKCDQDPSMYICLFGTDLDSGFDFIIKHIIVELCNMLLGNPTSRVKNYRSQLLIIMRSLIFEAIELSQYIRDSRILCKCLNLFIQYLLNQALYYNERIKKYTDQKNTEIHEEEVLWAALVCMDRLAYEYQHNKIYFTEKLFQGIPLYPPVIQAVIRAGCNTSLLSLIERSFHACTTHSMFTLPVNCNTRNNVLSYFK
jgi:hypothetical protein